MSIGNLVLCDKGTLNTTPTDPLAMGLRGEASFEAESYKPVETYMKQSLRNMMNIKVSSDTFQITMQMLKKLIHWSVNGFDAQIVTTKESALANSENVFNCIGSNLFGMDFEIEISSTKRAAKVDLERAFEFDRYKAFIDEASTNEITTISGISSRGVNYNYYRAPYFLSLSVNGSGFVDLPDIESRKLTIKSEGKKSDQTNMSINKWIHFELEIVTRKAKIADILGQLNNPMSPAILMKEKNSGSLYDGFDFAEGVLVQQDKIKFNDSEENRTAIFTGKVSPYDITYDLSTSGGAESGDTTGKTGGTIKVGY